MKKREVPSTSAIGAMVSIFQKGIPPFLHQPPWHEKRLSVTFACCHANLQFPESLMTYNTSWCGQ